MLNEFRDPFRGRRETPESTPQPRREKVHPDKPPYGSEGHSGSALDYVEGHPLKLAANDIVNHLIDGVYVANIDGLILDANPAFLDMLSVNSVSAVRGQSMQSLLSALPDQRVGELTGVFKLRGFDGAERTVRHYTTRVRVMNGEERVIGFMREVRGVFDKFMLHNQRLANLGTLAAKVVHDINNMLTAVNGFAELLVESPDVSEADRMAAQQIFQAGERAAEMALLTLKYYGTGKSAGTLSVVDMSRLVEETAKLLDILRPATATVEYDLSDDLLGVRGEPIQLQRVIMNLILNACEALDGARGAVRVSTKNTEDAPSWPGGATQASRYVMLEVSDNGKGMDEATRRRIFEPFFTSKGEGQGLGLATIAEILRMHQGSIAVESQEGNGSVFRAYLPAVLEAPID